MGEPLQNKLTCVGPAFTIGSTTSVTCACPANPVFSAGAALSGGGSSQTVAERALNNVVGAASTSAAASSGGNGHTSVSTAGPQAIAASAPVSVIPSRRKISHVQIHLLGPDNLVIQQPTSPTITSFAHPLDSHHLLQRTPYSGEADGSEHSANSDPSHSSHCPPHTRPGQPSAPSGPGGAGSSSERRSSMTIRIMPLTNGPVVPATSALMARSLMTPAPSLQQGAPTGTSAATSGNGSGSGSGYEETAPLAYVQQQQQQQQQQRNGEVRKCSEVTDPHFQQYHQMLHPAIPMQHSPARSVLNLSSNEGMTSYFTRFREIFLCHLWFTYFCVVGALDKERSVSSIQLYTNTTSDTACWLLRGC